MLTQGPTQEEERIVDEHFNYLVELAERGVVILAGRTLNNDETTFGIVIFRASSEASAQEMVNGDPAVRAGVMRAELFPFSVAVAEGSAGR
jgi:uncharacterized protein YciI